MSEQHFDYARVYIGPEPESGPHPGYRGPVTATVFGVLVGDSAEWLFIDAVAGHVHETTWLLVETRVLIPWHRIHSIEPEHEVRQS